MYLGFLTQQNLFWGHQFTCKLLHFFLQLNRILLHVYGTFSLSIHFLKDIKLFSLPGYVNKAVKNMAEQVSIE